VGIIPYVVNERIMHVNPIKLREYLSAGLPVVSTAFPEVKLYPHFCAAVGSFEQFQSAVETALRSDTPAQHRRRSDAMAEESWEKKVGLVGQRVMSVIAEKSK
jgi:hypothetical protein